MTEWSFETQMQAVEELSDACAGMMRSAHVDEMAVEIQAVGTRAQRRLGGKCRPCEVVEPAVTVVASPWRARAAEPGPEACSP